MSRTMLILVAIASLTLSCGRGNEPSQPARLSGAGESCLKTSDCIEGAVCIDQKCLASRGSDADAAVAPSDAVTSTKPLHDDQAVATPTPTTGLGSSNSETKAPGIATVSSPRKTVAAVFSEIESGKIGLGEFVDADSGVAFVNLFLGPVDGARLKPPQVVCQPELASQIQQWQRAIKEDAQTRREEGDRGSPCGSDFGESSCSIGARMEWDPGVFFVFEPRDSVAGYRLAAVAVLDVALSEVYDRDVGRAKAALSALRGKACPRKSPGQRLNEQGLAARAEGRHADAIQAYTKALEVEPTHLWARYNLACELALKGDASLAIHHLQIIKQTADPEARSAIVSAKKDKDFSGIRRSPGFAALFK